MDNHAFDLFEQTLRDGLLKLCRGSLDCGSKLLDTPDISGKWADYAHDYIADAIENFNEYPEAAIAWAAFLGMGVANAWDKDWQSAKDLPYSSYYGSRGWDDMDEHILGDVLRLQPDYAKKLSDALDSCALATLGLLRHEGIETYTADGYHCLVRSFEVMYQIGASLELERLGYKLTPLPNII